MARIEAGQIEQRKALKGIETKMNRATDLMIESDSTASNNAYEQKL